MFASIDGLRALGAMMVATAHGWSTPVKDLPLFHGAYLVVEMFFVLSGFMVARAYANRVRDARDAAAMVVKRFGRLYPLHIAVLLAWLVVFYGKQLIGLTLAALGVDIGMTPRHQQDDFDTGYFVLNLLMLHGMGFINSNQFNFPAWSISVEFWSFVFVALMFTVCQSRAQRLMVVAVGLAACFWHFGLQWWSEAPADPSSAPLIQKTLTRGLVAYLVGILAYELSCAWPRRLEDSELAGAQWLALIAVLVIMPNQHAIPLAQLMMSFVWAGVILALTADRGWLCRLLAHPVLVWIGKRSFSLYMTHALLLLLIKRRMMMIESEWLATLAWAVYLLLAIGLAALAHRYVEGPCFKPFQSLADRVRRPSGPKSTSHQTATATP